MRYLGQPARSGRRAFDWWWQKKEVIRRDYAITLAAGGRRAGHVTRRAWRWAPAPAFCAILPDGRGPGLLDAAPGGRFRRWGGLGREWGGAGKEGGAEIGLCAGPGYRRAGSDSPRYQRLSAGGALMLVGAPETRCTYLVTGFGSQRDLKIAGMGNQCDLGVGGSVKSGVFADGILGADGILVWCDLVIRGIWVLADLIIGGFGYWRIWILTALDTDSFGYWKIWILANLGTDRCYWWSDY
ncbi:hypothetical protein METBIDRAFT_155596 [Metschnikowia bicuspidata var. bicuspidata NRRL YB-4993]|uniref:Uncharacterized protein n=1 Tax=Metschnikowia bicuspidata var. bicuspidata NRRL YB-4993 TaxID=869754 RepID=A0A1A0HF04_9ASCO|nr:hypothetical protein METBIDRAFT_155596 [Metschnikowia bicuspidata var. bicuspidata NRRL YB-4993]OBA22560.1 hypothetical protein METBIDRAFT_155596 [Metschnikowia bicuspidata var. bicuspidata NRRL YB-4993]